MDIGELLEKADKKLFKDE
ncbi:hypothetical protein ABFA07_019528 [Porites harrisoni]